MTTNSGEVFVFRDGEITPLSARSMRTGLFGKNLEYALQTIFEKCPQLIPGKQIDPGSDEPPRFVLLRREMPVGGWSLDHLFADQNGILTLVETKLVENPESRREVVGQIIEYAANAIEAWSNGRVRQKASEYWAQKGKVLDDILLKGFGDQLDLDEYWRNLEANLHNGRLRLIIAADDLRPEVRRMVEYLNREMENAEVYGLEIGCFGDDAESLVIVPHLVGQTQENIDRKTSTRRSVTWSYASLKSSFEEISNERLKSCLSRILDWAVEKGCFLEAGAQKPAFSIKNRNNRRALSFSIAGNIYAVFEEKTFSKGKEDLDALQEQLRELKLVPPDFDHNEVVNGRNLSRKAQDLSDDEITKLLTIYEGYCN